MNRLLPLTAVLLAPALSACSETGSATCSAGFGGATLTSSTSGCAGCQIDGPGAAIDGASGTAALLVFNASRVNPGGGQIGLRATGRDFGGGSTVGAYMQFPRTDSGYANIGVSFVTYRAGVQQEIISGSTTGVGNIDGAGATQFYGGTTSQPFDAVEAQATLSGTGQPAVVQLFELCGNR